MAYTLTLEVVWEFLEEMMLLILDLLFQLWNHVIETLTPYFERFTAFCVSIIRHLPDKETWISLLAYRTQDPLNAMIIAGTLGLVAYAVFGFLKAVAESYQPKTDTAVPREVMRFRSGTTTAASAGLATAAAAGVSLGAAGGQLHPRTHDMSETALFTDSDDVSGVEYSHQELEDTSPGFQINEDSMLPSDPGSIAFDPTYEHDSHWDYPETSDSLSSSFDDDSFGSSSDSFGSDSFGSDF